MLAIPISEKGRTIVCISIVSAADSAGTRSMTQLHFRSLLLVSLLLVGWGLCTWLDDGAPWSTSSSNRPERSSESTPVDVRELIAAQSSTVSHDPAWHSGTHDAHSNSRATIELVGGTLADETAQVATPAWLTGEIEY